jgi:protein TonB
MLLPPPIARRLLTGGIVCTAHMAAIACMGAAFTAERAVQGGAPVINVMLAGQGFAGLASPQQNPHPAPPEVNSAKPLPKAAQDIENPGPPSKSPSRSTSVPTPATSRSTTIAMGAASGSSALPEDSTPSTAPVANASVASPSPGAGAPLQGASADRALDAYEAQVIAWLERHKRHPGGLAGRIIVRFTLDRRGRLLASSVVSGDGEKRLERAALSQLQEAAPFPRPPSDTSWRTRDFTVRLDFRSPRANG